MKDMTVRQMRVGTLGLVYSYSDRLIAASGRVMLHPQAKVLWGIGSLRRYSGAFLLPLHWRLKFPLF